MQIKLHRSCRDIIAVCDTELLGKYFEQGNFQLDVKESFFQGDEVDAKTLIKQLQFFKKEDATFNIIGEKSVECALKAGIINSESLGKIAGIPFGLILL